MSLNQKQLGKTGIYVSELCFGSLPMGPLQANLPVEEGARVLVHALEKGVNFIDTATVYRTYAHIRRALELYRGEVVVASKSGATTCDGMKADVEKARTELGRYPDIFLLHGARQIMPFGDRDGAVECLIKYKEQDLIRAIGLSTHSVAAARAAASQPYIDVVHPLINRPGLGILAGTAEEMADAIRILGEAGKGVYAMKALAGGNGLKELEPNLAFVRGLPGVNSVAVGMISTDEVEIDTALFAGHPVSDEFRRKVLEVRERKQLTVQPFCEGCGRCVQECPNKAMEMVDGKARVVSERCLLCGYCTPHCPVFAIRIV